MNAREWGSALAKQADELAQQAILDEQMKVALDLLSRVVLKNPVAEIGGGRSRGNWNVGLGTPDPSTTERTDRNSIGEGSTSIATITAPTVIYLSNNVPYIGRLEDGSSKQAPAGMVGVSVAEISAEYASVTVS